MNDGKARCPHGYIATPEAVEGYPKDWHRLVAHQCLVCNGELCGIPRIDHGRPSYREPADKEEPPAFRHLLPLLLLVACL